MSVYPVAASNTSCATPGCWCRDRRAHDPSDLTDREWEVLRRQAEAVMAELRQAAGRPMVHDLPAMLEAIGSVVRNGSQWPALPVDFPPWEAVSAFFQRCSQRGLPQLLTGRWRARLRRGVGRDAQLSAAIVDSPSIKAAEWVGGPFPAGLWERQELQSSQVKGHFCCYDTPEVTIRAVDRGSEGNGSTSPTLGRVSSARHRCIPLD